MRTAPIVAVAIATTLLLAGCTGDVESAPDFDLPVDPSPVPTVTEAVATPLIPAGTVVATGELVPVVGSTSGTVRITSYGYGDYLVEVLDLRTDRPEAPSAEMLPEPPGGEVDCSGNLTGVHGLNDVRPNQWRWYLSQFVLPDRVGAQDPAHFDAVALSDSGALPGVDGCFDGMTAYAPLTWTLPVFHEVPPVVDGGPREGASGATTSDAAGLLGYEVAEGDDSRAVAERFGLAMEDLVYFNPNLGGATDHPNLRPGSTQALRAPARS